MSALAAYKKAGYDGKGKSAEAASSQILSNIKVASYVKELREESRSNTVFTAKEAKEGLTTLMKSAIEDGDRQGYSALNTQLCKMEGFYHKEEVEVTVKAGGVMMLPMSSDVANWSQGGPGDAQKKLIDAAIEV